MSDQPLLHGVTVIDLSSVGPASRCSRFLADYGATVIKVGPTPKKGGVLITPPFFVYGANRGMKRMQVDLKSPEAKEAFLRLAATADVMIESFRPGVADRLGIGYDELLLRNPSIVYCSVSGYGQDGPYVNWAGHDINYLGLGGFLDCQDKRPDGGPAIPGATIADSAAGGMQAAMGVLAALLKRKETGEGIHLDVSIADGVLGFMSIHVEKYLATGEIPGPRTDITNGRYACYDVYECADKKWVAVGAIEHAFYTNLCKALGCEEWISSQTDDSKQDEIRQAFAAAFQKKDRDHWVKELAPANCCVSPVYSVPELVEDPQYQSRGVFSEAKHEEHGSFRQVGNVFAGGQRGLPAADVPSAEVTHTDELLTAAGIDAEELKSLKADGVIA